MTRTTISAVLATALLATAACSSGGSGSSSGTATLQVAPAPVGQSADRDDLLTPATATFEPADPGAEVVLQRSDDGEAWSTVEAVTAEQDDEGRARLLLPEVEDGVSYRAVSGPGDDEVASAAVRPEVQTEVFADDFDDPALYRQQWAQRYTNLYHGNRLCSTPDPDRLALGDGVLTLSVEQTEPPGSASPGDASTTCDDGVWDNAMIGTGLAPKPFTFTYGTAAARMRVQPGQGTHSAFWLQQAAPGGAEIDVVEYYGDDSKDGVQSKVHYGVGEDLETSGGTVKTRGAVAKGATPADGWHVYSVQWSPKGYAFAIDGVETWRTDEPGVSQVPEELVLSLLTSDWNLANMNDPDATLEVDWVRAWQDPKAATSQQ